MIYQIKYTNYQPNQETRQLIDKKLHALERLLSSIEPEPNLKVEVGLPSRHHQKGDIFCTKLGVSLPGKTIRAEDRAQTLLSSLEKATKEIKRELVSYKKKKLSQQRRIR